MPFEEPEPMIQRFVWYAAGGLISAHWHVTLASALHSGLISQGLIRTRVGDVRLKTVGDPALFKEWIDGQERENDEENN